MKGYRAMEKLKYLCKHCGDPLVWEDTYDAEGGIEEGWYSERQLWSCHRCDIDYVIEQCAKLTDLKTTYFQEA